MKRTGCELDSPCKNRFIGAVEATRDIWKALELYLISPSTGYDLWKKVWRNGLYLE
jgi:hypothetical protein